MQKHTDIEMTIENPLGIHPVEFKVLVKADQVKEQIGRIVLPDTVRDKEQVAQERGVLVAMGGRAFEDFKEPLPKKGDRVLFNRFAGAIIKDEKDRSASWRLLNDKDINAVLKEE